MPSLLSSAAFLSLASSALSLAVSPRNMLYGRSNSGQATFYGGNVSGGACSFATYSIPSGIYGTATANWDTAAHCGECVNVTYGGKSITAMIVDECPGCGTNHLDLFPDAFSQLAAQSVGVINVSWDYVNCPITSPIQLHAKSGASQYFFSMQVLNANQQVTKLEVSTDGGKTYQSTTRQDYNYFEISSGTGTSSVTVRVTGSGGGTVVVNNVNVAGDSTTTAVGNFGASGGNNAALEPEGEGDNEDSEEEEVDACGA